MLKALDFDDSKAWNMQLPCSIGVDFNVQFLSIFTQQVSKNKQIVKQIISTSFNCPNEEHCTLAPHCRSPLSWRWPCTTTCPYAARSHWTDVSGLSCWSLGSPHCPARPQDVKAEPLGRLPWLQENIPPWCRFFQSRSVRMQICRRDSHRCRT